jgi:hypothetical protein
VSLPERGARFGRRAAGAALALVVTVGGCYSTTPHRAEVWTPAAANVCTATISDVFQQAGFIQLPTPPRVSMFFAPRTAGPYHSFLNSGAGVGVTFSSGEVADGACHLTLEALSPDVGCAAREIDPYGAWDCHTTNTDGSTQFTNSSGVTAPCPVVASNSCTLSYAPGTDNDSAIDELARRLRVALGAHASVERRSSAVR